MNNPEDGGRQSEEPVIAIYRHPYRPGIYRVEVERKEIERLRSFDLHIHNDPTGAGGSYYTVEQSMPPSPRAKRAKEELGRRLREDVQRDSMDRAEKERLTAEAARNFETARREWADGQARIMIPVARRDGREAPWEAPCCAEEGRRTSQ